jgi:hypothetical protein
VSAERRRDPAARVGDDAIDDAALDDANAQAPSGPIREDAIRKGKEPTQKESSCELGVVVPIETQGTHESWEMAPVILEVSPYGQLLHDADRQCGLNVPKSQALQVASSVAPIDVE